VDARVAELLEQWEELRAQGREVTAAELCAAQPELQSAVERGIQALKEMDWMERPDPELPVALPGPPAVTPATPTPGWASLFSPVGDVVKQMGPLFDFEKFFKPLPQGVREGAEPIRGFRLVKRLGRGGYGEVWQATGPGGFGVALKFVAGEGKAGVVERRALEVIKNVRHPNLVTPFASWEIDGWLVVGMELADGTLRDRLDREQAQGRSGIPAPEVHEYLREAAKGLDHLNQPHPGLDGGGREGIQHRDVKPQNLLVFGGGVKVADFGLVRGLADSSTGHTGSMSVEYAAPEFFQRRTSHRSDQYSLGVTYCELRGGRRPFAGAPEQLMHGHLHETPDLTMLPEAERPVVWRALAKEPNDRWPSCLAFVTALGKV
jgi:serine/threonine protein kinase